MIIRTVILAAGHGTRMKSDRPKVLHEVAGRSLVEWSVDIASRIGDEFPTVVVGHGKEQIINILGEKAQYATQSQQLGTGHAVLQAKSQLQDTADAVMVIYGDMPLLRHETLNRLKELFVETYQNNSELAIAMLTVVREDSQGFGRIVRNELGEIQAIVEEADCSADQLQIRELNPGIYCFKADWLWQNLSAVPVSANGEYYLTDMVGIAVSQGKGIVSITAEPIEVNGINTRVHLANAEQVMRNRILEKLMLSGVTVVDPANTYIDAHVTIGKDTTVLPGTMIKGNSVVGDNCTIGPQCLIVDSAIGNHCTITLSMIEQAKLANECEIGPFAHLRPGAHLDDGVHLGNFGEVKNSYLGPGVKMGHFSYLGDAHIEADVNIGAGTITCNYDGHQKHQTRIGRNAFIGSDTMIVAPVTIGPNAKTGAGSVVTRDVPADSLVYGVPAKSNNNG